MPAPAGSARGDRGGRHPTLDVLRRHRDRSCRERGLAACASRSRTRNMWWCAAGSYRRARLVHGPRVAGRHGCALALALLPRPPSPSQSFPGAIDQSYPTVKLAQQIVDRVQNRRGMRCPKPRLGAGAIRPLFTPVHGEMTERRRLTLILSCDPPSWQVGCYPRAADQRRVLGEVGQALGAACGRPRCLPLTSMNSARESPQYVSGRKLPPCDGWKPKAVNPHPCPHPR